MMHRDVLVSRSNGIRLAAMVLGGFWLLFLWSRNYNVLGDLYDYSNVTSACGHLQAGLKPYRDFICPMQSLTIYLAYFAELIFGHRYLALAYANLVLGLVFYVATLRLLKNRLPPLLVVLVATSICTATFFQHGILWFNSIAIALLALLLWCGTILYERPHVCARTLACMCGLLFLLSMCKINFHLLALTATLGILVLLFFRLDGNAKRKLMWWLPWIGACGIVFGPFTEMVLNGATFHDFYRNVFVTPSGRLRMLTGLVTPNLYLGKIRGDVYPDDWSAGIFLKAFLIYCLCAYLVFFNTAEDIQTKSPEQRPLSCRWLIAAMLFGFFFSSLLLVLTNVDTEILTESFLVVGLVTLFIMFRRGMTPLQVFGFQAAIFLLSAFFLLAGGASAFMHSRVRFGEELWTHALRKNAIPLQSAESVSPTLEGYFSGVKFTDLSRRRMERIISFMQTNKLAQQPQKVYWGPGFEILTRVYGNVPRGYFPLWYHLGSSVRNDDGPRIVEAFKKSDFEWIVTTGKIREMPSAVRDYIDSNYENLGDSEVQIFHQRR